MGCRRDCTDLMAGVPQIAADLLHRQSRQPWANIGHLDSVIARIRDVATISAILSAICGADIRTAELGALAIGTWLRTGRG
jgi:hypothetical protein